MSTKIGNQLNLIGRFGKDPELKQAGDTYVCNFNLARNRDYVKGDHPETDWFPCVAFGKTAEVICKYFKKGDSLGFSGSLRTRSYESTKYTDENGKGMEVKIIEALVDTIDFSASSTKSGKLDSDNSEYTGESATKSKTSKKKDAYDFSDDGNDNGDDDDEELPF